MVIANALRNLKDPELLRFNGNIFPGFTTLHDNTRPHVAQILSAFEWPVHNPDLILIGHLRDALGGRILARHKP